MAESESSFLSPGCLLTDTRSVLLHTHLKRTDQLVASGELYILSLLGNAVADPPSRSPMAEAVLNHQIAQRPSLKERFNFTVDSAGTGAYHEGDEADERYVCSSLADPRVGS